MRIVKRSENKWIIATPSKKNTDLGIFLTFLGIVAVLPSYYLFYTRFVGPQVEDWRPTIYFGAVLVIWGMLLIHTSKRRLFLSPKQITIVDGWFRRSFTIRWENTPAVKFSSNLEEIRGKLVEFWQVSLMSGRLEYTLDRRPEHQLELRGLAEAVAKFLSCPFVEKGEDGQEVTIQTGDLDLPFQERVRRYPLLLGRPIPMPNKLTVKMEKEDHRLLFDWGIGTTGLLVDILALGLVFFIGSFVPWAEGHLSLYTYCAQKGDFTVYIIAVGILFAAILLVMGYRVRLRVDGKGVDFRSTIWGIAFKHQFIPARALEEIRLSLGARGQVLQMISDADIISFRLSDSETARWLSSTVQRYLLGEEQVAEI